MTRFQKLRKEAREVAAWRGHELNHFVVDQYGAIATCRNCSADVAITLRPMPNEIDIGGSAVAIGCKD